MKTTWFRIALLTLLSLGSLVALSIDAPVKKPSAEKPATTAPAPTAPPPATPAPATPAPTAPATPPPTAPAPATAPANDSRADEPTEADKKDPDGGFLAAPESDKQIELPPEMRGTADFDISFPIDI
jgi:hypothetical protein